MPKYLNTIGESVLTIGICARCQFKFPLRQLLPDPNAPGLLVCDNDRDVYDPYRLPPRQPDKITVEYVRPDERLTTGPTLPDWED